MRSERRGGRRWLFSLLAVLSLSACYDGDPTPLHDAVVIGREDVTGLSVSGDGTYLELGVSLQLVATGTTPTGTVDLSRDVTWTTSNPASLSVSDSGRVTALANGTAIITATLGQFVASATLIASDALLQAITVSGDATVDECGNGSYTATGHYADGDRDITPLVNWSVTDATVARMGTLAGSRNTLLGTLGGATSVVASRNGIDSAGYAVTVSDNLISINVTPDMPAEVSAGDSVPFTATGNRGAGDVDISRATTWSVTNDDIAADPIATVRNGDSSPGLLTAQSGGTGTLTGSCGGLSDAVPITVTYLASLAITNDEPVVMAINSELLLGLQGVYSNGSTRALNELAVWTVQTGTVVTVSNSAGSRGRVTAGSVTGQATVRATVEGKYYDVAITVQ